MNHPALSHFSYEEWNIVFRALRKAEKIHAKKFRDNDKRPYMIHIVEMIVEYLTRYSTHRIRPQDILALALHDVIEEVPECWRDILNEFWLSMFRDVLVLSTGWIPAHIRQEIMEEFKKRYSFLSMDDEKLFSQRHDPYKEDIASKDKQGCTKYQEECVLDVARILHSSDPFFKLINWSKYGDDIWSPEFQDIALAMDVYRQEIIMRKRWYTLEEANQSDEFIGLGNYCYFRVKDIRRKVQDMLHNMLDMEEMDKKKPGYIQTRRIKAYILWAKLKAKGMDAEYAEISRRFNNAGFRMLTHADMINILKGREHLT